MLYAWSGPSLLVVNTRGECAEDQRLSGYYFREARFVRTLQLRINGHALWPCEAASVGPDTLTFTYVHPEITEPSGGGTGQAGDEESTDRDGIPERSIDIRVTYTVRAGCLDVSATLANRARHALHLSLSWEVGGDFADIQEAEASHPEDHGLFYRTRIEPEDALDMEFDLSPQEIRELAFRVWPSGTPADLTVEDMEARRVERERWRASFTRIEMPGDRLAEQIVANNIRDFSSFPLLDGDREEWLAMQAGMPLYPAFFGRDAVTAGWQAGMIDRGQSLSAALVRLGRLQSNRFDAWHDEEPGRIPYQMRTGPLAVLNLNPYSAYYADYASPLMYVISLANLYAWVGDKDIIRRHWDTARRILDWARDYGDRDRDGYLEYLTRSKKGTKNQGWKDSGDAIVYDDGSPVPSPIATCELQGYWYVAQQLMGLLSSVMDVPDDARAHAESAAALKARFNRDWWMDDQQFYALALDPAEAQFDLARLYPEYRIPECVGGYARGERPVPGAYPRANTPQLWNATAFPLIVQTLLGLVPIASTQTLVVDPVLPASMPELILRDVRVGTAKATLRFWRDGHGSSKWEIVDRQGTLHVVRQPASESLTATWGDRAGAVLESVGKSVAKGG